MLGEYENHTVQGDAKSVLQHVPADTIDHIAAYSTKLEAAPQCLQPVIRLSTGRVAPSPAYLAGLFDGEGSVCIEETRKGNGRFCLRITLSNTVTQPLYDVRAMYGGSVCRLSKATRVWQWETVSNKALHFLNDVYPHLRIKANQAWIAICFQNRMAAEAEKHIKQGTALSENIVAARAAAQEILWKMHDRNKKQKTQIQPF